MKDDINKAIKDFSKDNAALAKILALFSAQMLIIFGRHFTKRFNDELMEANQALMNYYDVSSS